MKEARRDSQIILLHGSGSLVRSPFISLIIAYSSLTVRHPASMLHAANQGCASLPHYLSLNALGGEPGDEREHRAVAVLNAWDGLCDTQKSSAVSR
jgi:hypothetical protein